jgi:hypothetical protein
MLSALKSAKFGTFLTENDGIILRIKDGYGNDTERKEKHILYATLTAGSIVESGVK